MSVNIFGRTSGGNGVMGPPGPPGPRSARGYDVKYVKYINLRKVTVSVWISRTESKSSS